MANIQLTQRTDVQRDRAAAAGREIEVTVAVEWNIDIRERSYAVFEKPFIAGAPHIQIVGRLDVDQILKKSGARSPIRRSARCVVPASDDAVGAGAARQGQHHGRQAERAPEPRQHQHGHRDFAQHLDGRRRNRQAGFGYPVDSGGVAGHRGRAAQDLRQVNSLTESLSQIALELGPQDDATKTALAGKTPGEIRRVVAEARTAFASIDTAAKQLNRLVAENGDPSSSFPKAA